MKASQINPRSPHVFNSLGVVLVPCTDIPRLSRYSTLLSTLNPSQCARVGIRSKALNELKRFQDAIDGCDRAIAINSSFADVYIPRARR